MAEAEAATALLRSNENKTMVEIDFCYSLLTITSKYLAIGVFKRQTTEHSDSTVTQHIIQMHVRIRHVGVFREPCLHAGDSGDRGVLWRR